LSRARGPVESELLGFLRSRGIADGEAVGVAYSGGPDSTALLAALCALRPGAAMAIHVDHGIRPSEELFAERELCVRTCGSLGCPLTVAAVRPGAVEEEARRRGVGTEAAARAFRYRALRGAMRRRALRRVLMAHTRDDQAETVLMRFFGGSGSAGLRGIPAENGPFLRPFLGLGKADLLEYLESRGLAFSTDSTNSSPDYLRNRVRSILVPALDSSFPGWRKGVSRTARSAALDEESLSAAAGKAGFLRGGDGRLEAAGLLEAPDAVAARAIVAASGGLLGRDRFPWRLALSALEALRSGERAHYSGGGVRLERNGGTVLLGLDFPTGRGYFVIIDGPCRIRAGSVRVSAAWTTGQGIRADSFRFPIVVRSRRPGDAIASKGGARRLDELLSEWGVPRPSRGSVPVVEDPDGIVAVLGSSLGGKDRYRAGPSGSIVPAGNLIPSRNGARRLAVIVKGA
jgi:tRNA(Ile)-lysidine synthetase-like protein